MQNRKLLEELFPRMLVMDEGVIVADGATKEILTDAKLLEAHGLEKLFWVDFEHCNTGNMSPVINYIFHRKTGNGNSFIQSRF